MWPRFLRKKHETYTLQTGASVKVPIGTINRGKRLIDLASAGREGLWAGVHSYRGFLCDEDNVDAALAAGQDDPNAIDETYLRLGRALVRGQKRKHTRMRTELSDAIATVATTNS
ncbi:hypothetical protein CMO91_00065 [Candidatus Woesearchaeota archaeon]|jgi:hypothetical protein|nr:hypothetical protein [Candidatus Woesearchaeota archaeon]